MNIISPKTMWFLIFLVAVCSFFLFDHEYLYVPHIVSKTIFVISVLFWLTLICSAFFVHREAYKNSYATSGVITAGIYKKMRHPMYIGDVVLFVGIALLFPMMWVLVTAFCAILVFVWFMKIENGVLLERFGVRAVADLKEETKDIEKKERKSKVSKKKETATKIRKERKPRVKKENKETKS